MDAQHIARIRATQVNALIELRAYLLSELQLASWNLHWRRNKICPNSSVYFQYTSPSDGKGN